ncbi:putative deacylase [Mycoplana sp. BE70]|uniref:succinylglutamate desuccinylase/aspartoacylase domain-containing protein n=1 Tax=Mycoplana sp. BE70 TaxID=2817775 RepID=UPI00285B3B50|nr:succinylglutamate desuccinylase/aspartoacylase family protein [Mycoplana sp. BE70]MDR6757097.1 putative deacylase [Mycoplana sp. BE70]
MSLSAVWTDVDLEAPGRQVGFIRVEHSVHRSAYGTIPIPFAVFANGQGPTLLLMAGSHGDEYEGQLALTRLIREIDVGRIHGRILVLPAANRPAVAAGQRTSPLDDGNLNRSFGDSYTDTPTGCIAAFIAEELFSHCDAILDLHSGGSSLDHLSCSYADLGTDKVMAQRTFAALEAMNAPFSWAQPGCPSGPVAGRAALRKGAIHLSGEFGGGGRLKHDAFEVAERCIYRVLDHFGILAMEEKWRVETPTRFVFNIQDHFVYAPQAGVLESLVKLGDTVEAGQLAGYLHRPESPWEAPLELRFRTDGIVSVIRTMGRSREGDCLFQLLGETEREEILAAMENLA